MEYAIIFPSEKPGTLHDIDVRYLTSSHTYQVGDILTYKDRDYRITRIEYTISDTSSGGIYVMHGSSRIYTEKV